jgi:hypothetical protein
MATPAANIATVAIATTVHPKRELGWPCISFLSEAMTRLRREGRELRGEDQQQNHMFSYLSPEARVRKDHPLRAIRTMVDEVLTQLSRRFDTMYARVGRPSIAPEKLLRAQLLQMLYSIRSERLLMEEMDYNLLFRWFVGLNADDEVWDATTFTIS